MTRRLPPDQLNVQKATLDEQTLLAEIFDGCPDWMRRAGLAALNERRQRPWNTDDHNVHRLNLARNDLYFARVCRLLKVHGIGAHWGVE